MGHETFFNADNLDLDAALLAGFGVIKETEEAERQREDGTRAVNLPDQPSGHAQVTHARITERVGKVGRLQVTFVYHHGDHHHE